MTEPCPYCNRPIPESMRDYCHKHRTSSSDANGKLSAEQMFAEWFAENYPEGSVITDPRWHAPKILRKAAAALQSENQPVDSSAITLTEAQDALLGLADQHPSGLYRALLREFLYSDDVAALLYKARLAQSERPAQPTAREALEMAAESLAPSAPPDNVRIEIWNNALLWAQSRIRALAAKLPEQGAKVPPLDPTPEMIEAGAQRLVRWETGEEKWPDAWSALDVRAARNDAERCWRSMWLVASGGKTDA